MRRNFVALFALTLLAVGAIAPALVAQEHRLTAASPSPDMPWKTVTMPGCFDFITCRIALDKVKLLPGDEANILISVEITKQPLFPFAYPITVDLDFQRAQVPAGGTVSISGGATFDFAMGGMNPQDGTVKVSAGRAPKSYNIDMRVKPYGHGDWAKTFTIEVPKW